MAAERIISAVSDYPELYNSTLTSYRDPIKKSDAWKAVGKQLGLKEEDARKKWRNLRDVFTRKVKADRIRGATGKALKKWRYSELMAFLIPYIQRGRGTGGSNSTEEFDDGKDETTSTSDVLIDLDGSVVDTKMSPPLDNNLDEMTWKDSWQTAGQGDNEDEMTWKDSWQTAGQGDNEDEMTWKDSWQTAGQGDNEDEMTWKDSWQTAGQGDNEDEMTWKDSWQTAGQGDNEDEMTWKDSWQTAGQGDNEDEMTWKDSWQTAGQGDNEDEMTWKDSWQTAGQGDNEDEMFFMSLLPHLKRLPYRKKCAIKLKFHQLLHDAEFEDTD